ncbi:MAG: tRNA (N(6)-L-threonylcarbamoyladenosine(37)-C(2))-methylthiotransferase MtaB [Syntrophales bacterium]
MKLIKVAISTLGCKVNQYESAGILETLDQSIYVSVPFNTKADCYIINTCTVTGRTEYQSRNLIRRAIRKNPDACIIVTGCYAQVAPHDLACIPGVTLVAGNAEKDHIPRLMERLAKGDPQLFVSDICKAREFSGLKPLKFAGHTRAFLKIQDGCNSFCSYCIVPYARGHSRSLSHMDVLKEIETLALADYREIVLTGIHLGVYGQDLVPPSNLYEIMKHVDKNRLVERLRLSSIEITEISDDIMRLLAEGTTLCKHLHIPLQSGDDAILSAMKRNYDSVFFGNRLRAISQAIPDIALGLDVMVGFPGEGEEQFDKTLRLIAELPVAYLHVFPYSERPGTAASSLPGRVAETIKKRRAEILRKLGQEKRNAFAQRFVGKKLSVLIEDKKDRDTGLIRGLSDNYMPVVIEDGNSSLVNRVLNVIPAYSLEGKLYGRIATDDR